MADDPSCSIIRHKKGKPLKSGEKTIVLNVFNKFCEKYPLLGIKEVESLTAEFTGVSVSSIHRVRNEKKKDGAVKTPIKTRKRKKPVLEKFDDFNKTAVRLKVHNFFFFKNELPTLNKILSAVNDDPDLPNISRSSLHKLLLSIGFKFEGKSRKSFIVDREDITIWRRKYLKDVKELRKKNKKIFYLDETWVNEGHTTSKAWCDNFVKTPKQAFLSGLSTGIKSAVNKGKRLIVVHIGSEDGFVDGGLLVFKSKKYDDYHNEMNGDVFKNWFQKILTLLPPDSVIVMDNAPYHSVKLEKIPNNSWRKSDIILWLEQKNISFNSICLKVELLEEVKKHKHKFNKFVIDDMAEKEGHTILRLPPYHCNLNPIELVWGQVKGYVARNNKTYKLKDVKILLEKGVAEVTADKWRNCVKHVLQEENKMWEIDNFVDIAVDKLIINVGNDSSESDDSDEVLSGVNYLSSSDSG